MPIRPRVLIAASLVLSIVALTAVVVGNVGAAGSAAVLERSPDATTTTIVATTTTVPARFPPIPTSGDVVAVRTGSGLVLPAVGVSEGRWIVRTPCAVLAPVDGEVLYGAHVVLDPGHGGSEPGAVSPSGLLEKDLNLDIARRAAAALRAEGLHVVLTRDLDVRMTLQTRGELARALRPLAFVSIHHNAAPLGTADTPGPELYHQLADPTSRRLAGLLYEELRRHLGPFGSTWAIGDYPGARARQSVVTGDDFYGVLRNAQGVPAVLSEALYMTAPTEDALLHRDDVRDAEAGAIVTAVLRLVETDDPGSGFAETVVSSTPAGNGGGTRGCEDPVLSP